MERFAKYKEPCENLTAIYKTQGGEGLRKHESMDLNHDLYQENI